MFISCYGNWLNILNDDVAISKNKNPIIKMTADDVLNNPENVTYIVTSSKTKQMNKVAHYVRNADKRNIFSKGNTSN